MSLLLAVMAFCTSLTANADYYIGFISNDWDNIQVQKFKNGAWKVDSPWYEDPGDMNYYTSGTDGTSIKINIKEGYKATAVLKGTQNAYYPSDTADSGFAQTFQFSVTALGATSYSSMPIYEFTVEKDNGSGSTDPEPGPDEPAGSTDTPGDAWPANGYCYDVHWNDSEAIYFYTQGNSTSKLVPTSDMNAYRFYSDADLPPTFKIYLNDGYEAEVYYVDANGTKTKINFLSSWGYYSVSAWNCDHCNVYIETKKAGSTDPDEPDQPEESFDKPGDPWPTTGYAFDIFWDNSAAVSVTDESGNPVDIAAGAKAYRFTTTNGYATPTYISANPGFIITEVYYMDGTTKKTVALNNFSKNYQISVLNHNNKTIQVKTDVDPDAEPENKGYGFDLQWNIAKSVILTVGGTQALVGNGTSYHYWDDEAENAWEPNPVVVTAADGYTIKRIYHLVDGVETTINPNSYGSYILSVGDYSNSTVFIETEAEKAESPVTPDTDKVWPATGYGFDIEWNIPGSITIQLGSGGAYIDTNNQSSYRYWDESLDELYDLTAVYVRLAPGYKFNRVYYIDENGAPKNIVTYSNYYILNNSVNRKTVYIETEAEAADSKFSITFVNTPEALQSITLTGSKKSLSPALQYGVATDIEFNSKYDSSIDLLLNTKSYTVEITEKVEFDEDDNPVVTNDTITYYRRVYKLTLNGKDITTSAHRVNTGTYYYHIDIADGDKIEVQPFEVAEEKEYRTIHVEAPEGAIVSLLDGVKNLTPDANGNITVVDGTVLKLALSDALTYTELSYAGQNMLNTWTESGAFGIQHPKGGTITVNADATLKIVGATKVYPTVTVTAYIANAEGLIIRDGALNGPIIDLGEGADYNSDIDLPATANFVGKTMPAAETRRYTFSVSNPYKIFIEPKEGYIYADCRTNLSSTKEDNVRLSAYGIADAGTTYYIYCKPYQPDYKIVAYYAGPEQTISLKPTDLYGSENLFTLKAGYNEISYEKTYESPFSIKGVYYGDHPDYSKKVCNVGGQILSNFAFYVGDTDRTAGYDGETGLYKDLEFFSNPTVVRIFADGKSHTKKTLNFITEDGASASVVYDRCREHEDLTEQLQVWDGTEVAITPGAHTQVIIDSKVVAPDANGVCTYTATYGAANVNVTLRYVDPKTMVVTPAEGDITEAPYTITVAFPYALSAAVAEDHAADELIFKAGDDAGTFGRSIEAVADAECPTFNINFAPYPLPNAEYSLYIPAGLFVIEGTMNSAETELSYLLKQPFEFSVETSPSAGKLLISDYPSVALLFNELSTIKNFNPNSISVTVDGVKVNAEYKAEMNKFMAMFSSDAIHDGSELKLTVAAGAIAFADGTLNPSAITETWTFIAPKDYTYTIAQTHVAYESQQWTLVFDNADDAEVFNVNGIQIKQNGVYKAKGVITAVEGAEHPTFTITPQPLGNATSLPLGIYDIQIKDGTFTLDGLMESPYIADKIGVVEQSTIHELAPAQTSDEGHATSCKTFTIKFPNATHVTVADDALELILLHSKTISQSSMRRVHAADGSFAATPASIEEDTTADYPTFNINFEDTPALAGNYTLNIPEGVFTADGNDSYAIEHEFTFDGVDYNMIITPAGSEISLSAYDAYKNPYLVITVEVEKESDDTIADITMTDSFEAQISNNGEDHYEYDPAVADGKLEIKIPAVTLTQGQLTVTIPANSIEINGVAYDKDITATWSLTGKTTAISDILIDADSDAEFYNLQGVRVTNPAAGVYIIRSGNTTQRVLVK